MTVAVPSPQSSTLGRAERQLGMRVRLEEVVAADDVLTELRRIDDRERLDPALAVSAIRDSPAASRPSMSSNDARKVETPCAGRRTEPIEWARVELIRAGEGLDGRCHCSLLV